MLELLCRFTTERPRSIPFLRIPSFTFATVAISARCIAEAAQVFRLKRESWSKNKHAFLDPPRWSIFPGPALREEKQKELLKSGSSTPVRMRFTFATLFGLG